MGLEKTDNQGSAVEWEGPTGHPKKVAGQQAGGTGAEVPCRQSAAHRGKLAKSTRLSGQNGQRDRRVLDRSFKTSDIRGPGDEEPPAEDWSERQEKE